MEFQILLNGIRNIMLNNKNFACYLRDGFFLLKICQDSFKKYQPNKSIYYDKFIITLRKKILS